MYMYMYSSIETIFICAKNFNIPAKEDFSLKMLHHDLFKMWYVVSACPVGCMSK